MLLPGSTYAARFGNPLGSTDIQGIVRGFVEAVIYVGTPLVIVLIVWTGFLFVYARGNPQGISNAKKMAIKAGIGATVLFSLWAIVELVGNTAAGLSAASLLILFTAFFLYVYYARK